MKYETNPIESIAYPGYYHFPLADWVVVSPEGKVIDTLSGDEIATYTPLPDNRGRFKWWMDQYPTVDIPSFRRMFVHRIIAYTFLKCPGDPDSHVVNHIDGDKTNYVLNNLEWNTYSENIVHAYKAGLRSDNKRILVKDLTNCEIKEFYSLQAAARFFKVNAGKLHRHLNSKDALFPFEYKWEVIYKGEEWNGLTKDDIGKPKKGLPKPIMTICDTTGDVTVYESCIHMASILGVSRGLPVWWIRNKKVPKKYGFQVYYVTEYINLVTEDAVYLKFDNPKSNKTTGNLKRRKPVPIKVTNTITLETTTWDSTEKFANSLDVEKGTIQKSVHLNDGRWRQYHIKYLR